MRYLRYFALSEQSVKKYRVVNRESPQQDNGLFCPHVTTVQRNKS